MKQSKENYRVLDAAYDKMDEDFKDYEREMEEFVKSLKEQIEMKDENYTKYDQMNRMLEKLNIDWMESKGQPFLLSNLIILGLSPVCKICQEMYDTNEHFQTTLNCGHAFGENCIKTSLKFNKRCPVCNKKAVISDLSRVY